MLSDRRNHVLHMKKLHIAASYGCLSCVERHVKEMGADVNEIWDEKGGDVDERTPLMVAALNGKEDVVEYLLAEGAAVNVRSKMGCLAVQYAEEEGFHEIVEMILSHSRSSRYNINNNRNSNDIINNNNVIGQRERLFSSVLMILFVAIAVFINITWVESWFDTTGLTESFFDLLKRGSKMKSFPNIPGLDDNKKT